MQKLLFDIDPTWHHCLKGNVDLQDLLILEEIKPNFRLVCDYLCVWQ